MIRLPRLHDLVEVDASVLQFVRRFDCEGLCQLQKNCKNWFETDENLCNRNILQIDLIATCLLRN